MLKIHSVPYNVIADSTGLSSFVQLLLRPKSAKFSENSRLYSSRSSKVIELGVNRKRIYNFLLVINGNLDVNRTVFEIVTHLASKQLVFPPDGSLTPPRRGTHCNNIIIYTSLKGTFSGLQFCLRVYLHLFSRCCIPKTRNQAKFRQNLTLQQFTAIQGHRSWCQLKSHTYSYQSLIVTLTVSATVFEIFTVKARKWLNFHTPPLFEAPARGNSLEFLDETYSTKLEG